MSDSVDYDKRDSLKKVSALVGGAAVSPAIATPAIAMLLPSRNNDERRSNDEIETKVVDISCLYPGGAITVMWGGKPVNIPPHYFINESKILIGRWG